MSDSSQLVRSYADLLDLLRRDGVPHEANLETSEVVIPTQRGPLDAVLSFAGRPTRASCR